MNKLEFFGKQTKRLRCATLWVEFFLFLQPMDPLDAEAVSRHRSRRNQTRETVPAAKVQAHLRRLDEIAQAEGMDEAKMRDLLGACRRVKRYESVRRRMGQVC